MVLNLGERPSKLKPKKKPGSNRFRAFLSRPWVAAIYYIMPPIPPMPPMSGAAMPGASSLGNSATIA